MDEPQTFELLTHRTFSNLLGGKFLLYPAAGNSIEAELVSVTPLPNHMGLPREPFSLIFRAPLGVVVQQQSFKVQHGDFEQDVFLVPIGPDAQGMQLEAVFN